MRPGAVFLGAERCRFRVWAPYRERVELILPDQRRRDPAPLVRDADGFWNAVLEGVPAGCRYRYRLDGALERPDPASDSQPDGVHGPSEVIDHGAFCWSDAGWRGIPLERLVFYELHVGAFSPEGTFDAVIPRLEALAELGINALSLMPAAQFPGERNWGYDGVYPYAAQNSYGGPEGLKRLIDACHGRGLAVFLDVVYNHLGPEGNYLADFGPYFTDRYRTPWGEAINFDGPDSDPVRAFFIDNALHWLNDYHLDGLRLDAVHAIFDHGARPILAELADRVAAFCRADGRQRLLIAESDLNDVRLLRLPCQGGYGLDAQWHDDFHHALHALLTGEKSGYYTDFGTTRQLAKAIAEGFVLDGAYSVYRRRRHGSSSKDRPGRQFVVFSQNHDQVGNRPLGERLSGLVCFEALKLAAAATLCAPFVPLLFMGEEYGEEAPFQYFVDHSDPGLIEAVRQGRKREAGAFRRQGECPDPQAAATFAGSRLRWEQRESGKHQILLGFYRELLRIRSALPTLHEPSRDHLEVRDDPERKLLMVNHRSGGALLLMNFDFRPNGMETLMPPPGPWFKLLDSADRRWLGPGSVLPEHLEEPQALILAALSAVFFRREIPT